MKRKFYFLSLLAAGAIFAVNIESAYTNSGGAIASRSGSPGDNNMNCGNSGCHPSNAVSSEEVTIDVILPDGETAFVAGNTYTVEVTGSKTAGVLGVIGFQATVEDDANDKLGELSVLNADATKIVGSDYMTHKLAGSVPTDGSRTWAFEWTAPSEFSGNATVHTAVLFGNGNGMWTGDVTVTASKTIEIEETGLGLEEAGTFAYNVFPNPSSDMITLTYDLDTDSEVNILVMDMTGREVAKLYNGYQSAGQYQQTFDLNLSQGNYLIALQKGKRKHLNKLVVVD